MQALKNFLYKFGAPGSNHPLALFHHCDLAVIHQMSELGNLLKTTPNNLDRRSVLIQLVKHAQHNLIDVLDYLVNSGIPDLKTSTEFRVKYPDDLQIAQMNGTIWFNAECLAAGSLIANHEIESLVLKPYAVRLSRAISNLRKALREEAEQYDEGSTNQLVVFSENIKELLVIYDKCWVEFEFKYVSIMCNIQTETQLFHQQEIAVLFSEAIQRALKLKYFDEDMIEMMDPTVMFAIPRLAIVCGLAINTDGPLNPQRKDDIPACFGKYKQLLSTIQESLSVLNEADLMKLEKALCSSDGFEALVENSSTTTTCNEINVSTSENLTEETVKTKTNKKDLEFVLASSIKSLSLEPINNDRSPDSNDTIHNLLHALFIAVSRVADQLQSNYPRDYRAIMKQAYAFYSTEMDSELMNAAINRKNFLEAPSDTFTFDLSISSLINQQMFTSRWVDDNDHPNCHRCKDKFTFFRRKHHCRSCGQVVCGQCSPHYLPDASRSSTEGSETWRRMCTICYIHTLGKLTRKLINTRSNQSIIVL